VDYWLLGFAKAAKGVKATGIALWVPGGGGTFLKTAKRNAEIEGVADKVEFKRADARNIPYPDNCFDIVVVSFVLHTIYRKREAAFKEMIRVLKPKGRFAIIEPPGGYVTLPSVTPNLLTQTSHVPRTLGEMLVSEQRYKSQNSYANNKTKIRTLLLMFERLVIA